MTLCPTGRHSTLTLTGTQRPVNRCLFRWTKLRLDHVTHNVYLMRSTCCVNWPPRPCQSHGWAVSLLSSQCTWSSQYVLSLQINFQLLTNSVARQVTAFFNTVREGDSNLKLSLLKNDATDYVASGALHCSCAC